MDFMWVLLLNILWVSALPLFVNLLGHYYMTYHGILIISIFVDIL